MPETSPPPASPKPRNLFYPPAQTAWERFKWNPTLFLAKYLYSVAQSSISPVSYSFPPIKVVCISDTHNQTYDDIPDADIVVHAGDLTNSGSFNELQAQITWLNSLPHRHKIAIAGNHDLLLDDEFIARSPSRTTSTLGASAADLDWGEVIYLHNSSTTVSVHGRSIKIYGSSWTPQYGNWAFQYPCHKDLWKSTVPQDTDILVTHGPPKGHLDMNRKGCAFLAREVERVKPRLTVFGHIHEGRGREDVRWDMVEGLYGGIVRGKGGWMGVLAMGVLVAWEEMIGLMTGGLMGGNRRAETTMVNAAMAWGKEERWGDKVVEI